MSYFIQNFSFMVHRKWFKIKYVLLNTDEVLQTRRGRPSIDRGLCRIDHNVFN